MKKLCLITTFMFSCLTLIAGAFGWGQRVHPCIGFLATPRDGYYLNANNGPDICHFIIPRDALYAHSEIGFANEMVAVAGSSPPSVREKMMQLAYGWGSHIKADEIAHTYMLPPEKFDTIEHGLVEIAIDWWLWNNGSGDEQNISKEASVVWSSWLIYETSIQYGKTPISLWKADLAGTILAVVIAGETVLMISPGFYDQAMAYSDDTRSVLEDEAWRSYYDGAIDNVKKWLVSQRALGAPPAKVVRKTEPDNVKYTLLKDIGERAIRLGGIQTTMSSDSYFSRINIKVKDRNLCQKALREVLSEKLKTATGSEKEFALVLSGVRKSSVKMGEIKSK